MSKIFIEVESLYEFDNDRKEDLAEAILQDLGHGTMIVSIKDDINELPEIKDAVQEKSE